MKERIRKVFKIAGRIILALFLCLAGLILVLSIRNIISGKSDRKLYSDAYGTYYTLQTGERVNYTFYDSPSDEVAVILPGFGCASVHYEFDTLAKRLSNKYKIVIYEPLGYGLSDETTRKRNTENYCTELHELMSYLGYNRYTLIGHSISGIYALKYSNMYPEEMAAFIGIDSSVPHQADIDIAMLKPENTYKLYQVEKAVLLNTGIYRVNIDLTFDSMASCIPTLSENDKKIALAMNRTNLLNPTQMSELKELENNMKDCYNLKFPEEIPVLYLVSSDSCSLVSEWESMHNELITNPDGKVVKVSGEHYLHISSLDTVLENIDEFYSTVAK